MPGYQTQEQQVAVRGVRDLTIRGLLDRQQFADPEGEAEALGISAAAWPLFGLVWPSGVQLAARLALRPVVSSERILEIGCGLGLASLVAHRRGADITASDCHPLAEAFLLENLRLNGLAPLKYRHGHWGAVAMAHGVATGCLGGLPVPADTTPPRVLVEGRFDLIVGSDVLYERDTLGHMAAFCGAHALPAAEVWIVDPDRGNRSAFNRRMEALGFERHEERLDRAATPLVAAYKGRLLTYRRGH